MITLVKYTSFGANRNKLECVGLSTDELPTDAIEGMRLTNGSTVLLMDTSEVKMFDEENKKWHLL